jgi:hypothetical protein
MVMAKWHVRRTSGAPKALAVALSFCCLLGLGCPKQAFAKIATPRRPTALRLLGTTSPRVRSPWLAATEEQLVEELSIEEQPTEEQIIELETISVINATPIGAGIAIDQKAFRHAVQSFEGVLRSQYRVYDGHGEVARTQDFWGAEGISVAFFEPRNFSYNNK